MSIDYNSISLYLDTIIRDNFLFEEDDHIELLNIINNISFRKFFFLKLKEKINNGTGIKLIALKKDFKLDKKIYYLIFIILMDGKYIYEFNLEELVVKEYYNILKNNFKNYIKFKSHDSENIPPNLFYDLREHIINRKIFLCGRIMFYIRSYGIDTKNILD